MHKLKLVTDDPKYRLEAVIEAKRNPSNTVPQVGKPPAVQIKTVLETIKPDVLDKYQRFATKYKSAIIQTIEPSVWTRDQRYALEHSYSGETKPLRELKKLIHEAQPTGKRKLCPYCGISPTSQFDHYLPQSLFPEFSVHPHNLTPSCGVCNNIKLATWLKNDHRVILNMYIDALPNTSFLKVDIKWIPAKRVLIPAVTFQLVCPIGFPNAKYEHLKRHVQHLKLLTRFSEQVHSEFTSLKDSAQAEEANSVPELRAFLTRFIEKRTNSLGPLNWKLALYSKLIEHDPFLKECLV